MICEDIGAGPQWNPAMGGGIWRRDAATEKVFLQNLNDRVVIGVDHPFPFGKLDVGGEVRFFDPQPGREGNTLVFSYTWPEHALLLLNEYQNESRVSIIAGDDSYGNRIITDNPNCNAADSDCGQGLGIAGGTLGGPPQEMNPFSRLVVTTNDMYLGYKIFPTDGSESLNPPFADGNLYIKGNTGIGTKTPGSKLTVHGTGGDFNTSVFHVENSLGTTILHVLDDRRIGIRTSAPDTALHVAGDTHIDGTIKIEGGTPGTGKVLTSDATGLASWQSVAGESVMYLRNVGWGPDPKPCPAGWAEADFQDEFVSVAKTDLGTTILENNVRTCYRCP